LIIFFLGIFVTSLIFSFALTREVRDFANAHAWVSPPTSERHMHSAPLPRLGGVAIFASFVVCCFTALVIARYFSALNILSSLKPFAAILLPASLVFALGVYDDLRPIGPYAKFSVQTIAAVILYAGGLRVVSVPVLFGSHQFSWLVGLPLTILWVLAITNAFNLIDGLDGLAAGSALFSTMVVFVVSLVTQSSLVSLMALALSGAVLGFLRFNFSPATVFLGDCGSLFIGFILSALALQGASKAPTIIAVAIPVVSFGLPILETTLSILRRYISGRPVFTGDREHIHHKLLQRGLSHRQVVIVLYGVSAIFALFSLFLLWPASRMLGLVLAILGLGIWVGVQRLGYLEFGEIRRVAQKTLERQHLINNLAILRATEELKKSSDYLQVCRILIAALDSNEFDALELRPQLSVSGSPPARGPQLVSPESPYFRWVKPGSYFDSRQTSAWSLNLELVTSHHRRCGSMTVYRLHNGRNLQVDLNLLTSVFPIALAEALDRASIVEVEDIVLVQSPAELVAAQAG
jgi:UDP-GlcNAc:undecaprenyl-phosphate/decaprenyl-phosphate GlcNAc-1-phosphate transferase